MCTRDISYFAPLSPFPPHFSSSFLRPVFFYLSLSPAFRERIFPCRNSFPLVRAFPASRIYPACFPFFNLFLLPSSFYLTPLLPSRTAGPVTCPPFFSLSLFPPPSPLSQPGGIFVLFYFLRPSPVHFSFSFDAYAAPCPFRAVVRAVASFIVFVPRCVFLPYTATAALPSPRPISLQVFRARKRALSYFARLSFFLAFVPPAGEAAASASARAIRYVTFSAFLFGMYVRYPIRDPRYPVSILSSSVA